MLINLDKLIAAIKQETWAKGVSDDKAFLVTLIKWIEQDVIPGFLDQVIRQVDDMIDINPDLSEPEILGKATRSMVDFLGAHHASVRIYDPQTGKMLSFGSYPSEEEKRETFIPLKGSIAGEVVMTRRPYLVPNILEEKRYHNKGVIYKKGVRSLMAIPLEIPRFFPHERDMVGVIQIYYSEKERDFTSLEVQTANLMAKRLSFVIARKKILSMHRTDEIREAIVRHIFRTMGARGGVKMREVFNSVIPELADMVNLQSCAFFSVTEDLSHVILEAGYPEAGGYHSIGKSFPVSTELAYGVLMNPADYSGESVYEVVTPSYILIVDPQKSDLISKGLKKFAMLHKINSILYIPLRVDGELTYFMTFDALDERQRYRDDEIDTFLFLGRELVRARKMERLDDALHDFKNPAIATAGFARRLKKLLDKKETEKSKKQIRQYASILLDETSRLQELALSIYHMGKEEVVNLTEVLRRRFDINKEVIREQLKQKVRLKEGPFDPDLNVRCYVLHVERIFDNLLNNATKAIPHTGGVLEIRTYADSEWACAEITNTGHMSDEDRVRFLVGEGRGRGFYITQRIIRLLKGKIEISGGEETTTFVVRLPRLS
jgi:signal transduction histidine kinase